MDLWSGSPAAARAVKMRPNSSGVVAAVPTGDVMPDQWMQDEPEIKRQKRKQSNRESARRLRLRKHAECEELQSIVETLANENHTLREELKNLSDECEKLTSENSSIKGDQFLNSKLVAGDLKAGVEVSRRDHDLYFSKENIKEAVDTVMVHVDKEPGMSMRKNHTKWKEFILNEKESYEMEKKERKIERDKGMEGKRMEGEGKEEEG